MSNAVIDFRVRPPLPSFTGQQIFTAHTAEQARADPRTLPVIYRGREESRSAVDNSMSLFFEEFERAGISRGVVMGRDAGPLAGAADNREIAEFCAAHSDRFDGIAGIDGRDQAAAIAEVQFARDAGLVGVAFDNGLVGLHHDDQSLWPVYEKAAELGLIIVITASQLMGADSTWSHPDRIRPVARAFSGSPIVVAHAAWSWTTQACALAYECQNVYLLPDCYLNTRAPGSADYVDAANTFMPDRLLYGSAYPLRPLGSSLSAFMDLPLDSEARSSALWDNAARLLESARR